MADYIVKDTELTSVANAIRTAGGTNSLLNFPNGFVSAVNNISGGGSSDFSTAEVTINDPLTKLIAFYCASISDEDGDPWSNFIGNQGNHSKSNVILYKGTASIYLEADNLPQYSTSGDIVDDGDGYFYVTGDCTITIS